MTDTDTTPVDPADALVDASGQRMKERKLRDGACPHCWAGRDRRVASCGYGPSVYPICGRCGHEFRGESMT